jgi:small-conductance mechanosensitive channel
MTEEAQQPDDVTVVVEAPEEPQGLVLDFDVAEFVPEPILPAWELLQHYPLLMVLLLLIFGYLLGRGLQLTLQRGLERAAGKTQTDLDDRLIRLLTAPLLQTTVIVSLIFAVKALNLSEASGQFLGRLLVSLLVIFWARAWFKATHLALDFLSGDERRFEIFQPRTTPLFEMGIKLLLLGVFAYLLMGVWGIDGTAWLASAGILGIAIGFAAKDTLANLISGVSIVADAPYKIGDYIVLDTGERGIVSSLGMRSTRLVTRDDVEISIPNAVIGNAKITNESGGPWVKQRIRIPLGVAYGSDTEKVVEILEQVAKDNPEMIDQPAPRVRMRGFGDSSLDFELMGWINLPELRGLVRHQILMEIDRRFRQEGIEIPFPQRDVHMRGEEGGETP